MICVDCFLNAYIICMSTCNKLYLHNFLRRYLLTLKTSDHISEVSLLAGVEWECKSSKLEHPGILGALMLLNQQEKLAIFRKHYTKSFLFCSFLFFF